MWKNKQGRIFTEDEVKDCAVSLIYMNYEKFLKDFWAIIDSKVNGRVIGQKYFPYSKLMQANDTAQYNRELFEYENKMIVILCKDLQKMQKSAEVYGSYVELI